MCEERSIPATKGIVSQFSVVQPPLTPTLSRKRERGRAPRFVGVEALLPAAIPFFRLREKVAMQSMAG
jgi:hypothetical protein